ncbi:MAG: hypothetical protein HQ582_05145 [Planctomycetes bacterium]|nr:hypothetical protein [Planctomycetota bacterium]
MAFEAMAAEPSASPSPPPVTVTFEPDPVKTGYTIPASDLDIKVRVTATVEPISEVGNITITSGGPHPERIEIENFVTYPNAGKIEFDVKGKRATPGNIPNGDTTIEAKKGDSVCGAVQAIVLIPKSLTPTSTNGIVSGVNQCAWAGSSLAYFGLLAEDWRHLWTYYVHWLPVAVVDQFDDLLAPCYERAEVREGSGLKINQQINAFGTYLDPVGRTAPRDPLPASSNYHKDSTEAANWPNDPHSAMPIGELQPSQTFKVKVGGHLIQPGVVNRRVISSIVGGQNNVQIIWQ